MNSRGWPDFARWNSASIPTGCSPSRLRRGLNEWAAVAEGISLAGLPGAILLSDLQFCEHHGERARACGRAGLSVGTAHSICRVDHLALLVFRPAVRALAGDL